jgi:cell division protein FtsB
MKIVSFIIRHKYGFTIAVFMLYMLIGEDSFLENFRLQRQIREMEEKLHHYHAAAESIRQQNAVRNFYSEIEKEAFLRIQHNMKRHNEDVFRIVEAD